MKRPTVQMFSVKNNVFGRLFIWYLKKHLNKDTYKVRLRGRGNRVNIARRQRVYESTYQSDLPLEFAQRIGIYIDCRKQHREYLGYKYF